MERQPASAGIYCFLITSLNSTYPTGWPASAGIYCFLITIINKWSHIPFIDTYHGTLKQFYYNEIIHYFEKATFIFNIILLHNDVYIANINKMEFDPIRPYRVDNFINISNSIIDFLLNELSEINISNELNKDIIKLNEQVKEFKRQWNH